MALLVGLLAPPGTCAAMAAQTIDQARDEARRKLREGDAAGAVAMLEPLAREGPVADELRALLGTSYLAAGRPAEALAALEPLIEAGRADPQTLFLAGRAADALGRRDEARAYLEESVRQAPVTPAAVLLAGIYEVDENIPAALRVLRPLAEGLAAEGLITQAPALALEVHGSYARLARAAGDLEAAAGSLRRITELAPDEVETRRRLGEILLELGRVDDAYEVLAEAQAITERRQRQQEDRARAERDLGGSVVNLIRDAHTAQKRGAHEEALALLRRAMQIAPTDARPRVLEIRLLIGLRREAEALAKAETLVEIFPEHTEGYYLRGMALLAQQKLTRAEEDLRRVLEMDPRHLAGLNGLAILQMARGENEAAEQTLLELLRHWPKDEQAQRNLERVRQRLGRG